MRLTTLGLILAFGISSAPLAMAAAQSSDTTNPDTTKKAKKPPSKLAKIAKGAAGTAGTAAAGAGVQAVLGKNAGGVANALGGVAPCGAGYGVTAGAAIVGVAKGVVKAAVDTSKAPSQPCGQAAIPGMPAGMPAIPGMPGMPGMPSAGDAGAAMAGAAAGAAMGAAAAGANPMAGMGGVGAMAGMTPIGLAAGAAPGAIKGIKGMLGGKPQDKLAMVRELGKGKLEFKSVKFIEGTLEFEPGFEESFVAFAEAISLVEGTYLMYVSAEAPREKGAQPDTVLSHKRVAKVWSLMKDAGVSEQRVTAVTELPASLSEGRKLPKAGSVKVEIIKFEKQ
jgi:hypothetical protein